MTYDATQLNAVLVQCDRCRQSYYMTRPQAVCIVCRRRLSANTPLTCNAARVTIR